MCVCVRVCVCVCVCELISKTDLISNQLERDVLRKDMESAKMSPICVCLFVCVRDRNRSRFQSQI